MKFLTYYLLAPHSANSFTDRYRQSISNRSLTHTLTEHLWIPRAIVLWTVIDSNLKGYSLIGIEIVRSSSLQSYSLSEDASADIEYSLISTITANPFGIFFFHFSNSHFEEHRYFHSDKSNITRRLWSIFDQNLNRNSILGRHVCSFDLEKLFEALQGINAIHMYLQHQKALIWTNAALNVLLTAYYLYQSELFLSIYFLRLMC